MTNIKVIEINGEEKEESIIILAGVHGNENFGVAAIEEIIQDLRIEKGRITIIFANLEAIKQNKRFVEYNLNRCFLKDQPKELENTLEGKTAREIIPYLDKADYLLDIHGSNSLDSIPFMICQPNSFSIAEQIPFKIISYNWDDFEQGSSDYYMNLKNKIAVCVECGYIGDQLSKERAKIAIKSFLKATLNKNKTVTEKKYYKIIELYKNKYSIFKKAREFSDFELLEEDTIIGKDGTEDIIVKKGKIIIFVRDRNNIEEECFLIAEETKDRSKLK